VKNFPIDQSFVCNDARDSGGGAARVLTRERLAAGKLA